MAFNETEMERPYTCAVPFVLVARACAERNKYSWWYWLGKSLNDGAIPVLRRTVSRVVSTTEQPPVTGTGLLEQSAPRGSLQRQTVSQVVSSTEQPLATLKQSTTLSSLSPAINSLAGTRTMAS